MNFEDKINEMNINLTEPPEPVANYIPAKITDNLVFCSGQGPIKDGEYIYVGRVGNEVTLEEGYESARMCAINSLAAVKSVVGSLNNIKEIVKVKGYVNSASDFYEQPQVVNGASDLFVDIFGEKGRHVRSALGTSNLPDNIPVELELTVKIKNS